MDQWQTMDTAPKDGTFVLAYDIDSFYPDDPEESYWIVRWDDRNAVWRIMLDGQRAKPTHWMPRPAPPKRS